MAPTLYQFAGSPPVRAVLMTAKSIGLQLNDKQINILKGDQKTPEFAKINPQHTIPTLVEEDGWTLWDSHAIMAYLVTKYAKDDSLYPKDPRKRALIDQRLHFESSIVFERLGRAIRAIVFGGAKTLDPAIKTAIEEGYGFMEAFLEGRKWFAGDTVTIADFSLISSVTSSVIMVPIDAKEFPKLKTWLNNAEKLPEYQANVEGLANVQAGIREYLGA